MSPQPPEPDRSLADPAVLLINFLGYYRACLFDKVAGLTDDQLRRTLLPSGWTPLELIKHLAYVERRWIRWGFLAEQVGDPWGDQDPGTERWSVRADETLPSLHDHLFRQAALTDRVLAEHGLDQRAALGGRFSHDPPTLSWIGFHLLEEYARHVGHLDIVRELIDDGVAARPSPADHRTPASGSPPASSTSVPSSTSAPSSSPPSASTSSSADA